MPAHEFKNNIPPNIPVGLFQQTPQTVPDGRFRPFQILQSGELVTADLMLQIARGEIPGMTSVLKFGRNPEIDQNVTEDVWTGGGIWVPPTTARFHDVASSDIDDVGALLSTGTITSVTTVTRIIDTGATFIADGVTAGDVFINDTGKEHGVIINVSSETEVVIERFMSDCGPGLRGGIIGDTYRIASSADTGAAVILLIGLNASWEAECEYVILNGTTNVTTTKSYQRIFRMTIVLAGSSGWNEGNISATAQTDGTVTAHIFAQDNQSQMAIYTIPANTMGYIISYYLNMVKPVTGVKVVYDLLIHPFGEVWQVKHHKGLVNEGTSDLQHDYEVPLAIPPKADIKIRATSSANDVDVAAGFDLILVDMPQ